MYDIIISTDLYFVLYGWTHSNSNQIKIIQKRTPKTK
jgi:hypothetical protein